jgi:hypothetical protein
MKPKIRGKERQTLAPEITGVAGRSVKELKESLVNALWDPAVHHSPAAIIKPILQPKPPRGALLLIPRSNGNEFVFVEHSRLTKSQFRSLRVSLWFSKPAVNAGAGLSMRVRLLSVGGIPFTFTFSHFIHSRTRLLRDGFRKNVPRHD